MYVFNILVSDTINAYVDTYTSSHVQLSTQSSTFSTLHYRPRCRALIAISLEPRVLGRFGRLSGISDMSIKSCVGKNAINYGRRQALKES